jgi:hypothetical protein
MGRSNGGVHAWGCTFVLVVLVVWPSLFVHGYTLDAAGGLSVTISETQGNYQLHLDGKLWLGSGVTGVHAFHSWWLSNTSSVLAVRKSAPVHGVDAFGSYHGLALEWGHPRQSAPMFETTFRAYKEVSAIVFSQRFLQDFDGMSLGDNKQVVSVFPSFRLTTPGERELDYLTYHGIFLQPQLGRWRYPKLSYGVEGGPVVLHDIKLRALVISPLNNFMVGSQTQVQSLPGEYACGLQGKVERVPAGFVHETLAFAGQGVRYTMYLWGDLLLHKYGKPRTRPDADLPIQYLGYWTDNGAYYYYKTEPGTNYQTTMIDVKKYINSISLPVQNMQFDSWWYFKEDNATAGGGLINWIPRPDIFPSGMGYVDEAVGRPPLTLHNRYFSPKNVYCRNFTCIIEKQMALPLDPGLFTYMMAKAKQWGLAVYEQDWLITTYLSMECTQNNVTNARDWLLYMGDAARRLGLTIQYCMPLPNHVLQSVGVAAVTQIRASDDYQPGNSQWQIGYSSLIHHVLGVMPFKDNFWTTENQPGCIYPSGCVEPNPELQTLVAALSCGPVGPSDMIGSINKTRVMQTCRKDGLLLKPDRPALPVESIFIVQFTQEDTNLIQVWETFSAFDNGDLSWHYILAADLARPFLLTVADCQDLKGQSMIFSFYDIANTLTLFDSTHPFKIPAQKSTSGPSYTYTSPEYSLNEVESQDENKNNNNNKAPPHKVNFNYYVTAPILDNGWVVLGETSKFVTMSAQRITEVVTISNNATESERTFSYEEAAEAGGGGAGGGVSIGLVGVPGEVVSITVLPPGGQLRAFHCAIPSGGYTQMIVTGSNSWTCQ